MKNIEHNIIKMYFFRFLRDFWLIMPMLIPFYKSFHLSNTEILLIQSIFSLSLLIFEIPSGYFSDAIGRKLTLIIGSFCLPLGLSIYSIGSSFFEFAIAEAVLGIGFAMCSGTESALIYDSLLQINNEKAYHQVEGKAESFTRIGTAAASVLGGILAGIFLKLPFFINIITGLLMFILALTFAEPDTIKRKSENPLKDIIFIVKYSLGHTKILSIIILSSVVLHTGITAIWGYLMIMEKQNLSVMVNGIGFALFQMISAAGAVTSHKISAAIGKKNSYLILAVIPLTMFIVGISNSPFVLICVFAHSYVWGFSFPFFMNELNNLIDSDKRATVLSTGSMIGRIFFVILSPVFGLLSDSHSLGYGFLMLGTVFILLSAVSIFFGRKDFSL